MQFKHKILIWCVESVPILLLYILIIIFEGWVKHDSVRILIKEKTVTTFYSSLGYVGYV